MRLVLRVQVLSLRAAEKRERSRQIYFGLFVAFLLRTGCQSSGAPLMYKNLLGQAGRMPK
jgi:hypothetical protein